MCGHRQRSGTEASHLGFRLEVVSCAHPPGHMRLATNLPYLRKNRITLSDDVYVSVLRYRPSADIEIRIEVEDESVDFRATRSRGYKSERRREVQLTRCDIPEV